MNSRKFILLSLLVCLAAASCEDGTPLTAPTHEDKVDVRFVIRTGSLTRSVSRAADNPVEYNINDLTVIVLKSDGSGGFVGDYIVPVEDLDSAASSTITFTVPLYVSNTKVKLLFIANSSISVRGFLTSHATDFGDLLITEAELRATLIDPQPIATMTMTGEVTLDAIAPGSAASSIAVPLVRYLAKVEIFLKLSPGSPGFEPRSGYIYRSNDVVQLFPNPEAFNDPLAPAKVVAPSVPAGAGTVTMSGYVTPADTETGLFFTAYLPESEPATTFEEQLAATCMVIGGSFDGGPTTYYRVDFNSGKAGHPFGQVLRNYHYAFNITKMTTPGADDPDTASETLSSKVVVDGTWERVEPLDLTGS